MKALLSSTSNSDTMGKRTLKASCLAILLCVLVDVTLGVVLPDGNRDRRFVRERLSTNEAPDIQVLGDSVVRSGVLASALSSGTVVARNDGVVGSAPPFSYLLVKQSIVEGKKPRAIVIYHSPHTFDASRDAILIGTFAYWDEVPELAMMADHWSDIAYGVLARLSYLLANRDYLRLLLTRGDTGFLSKDQGYSWLLPPDSDRVEDALRSFAAGITLNEPLPTVFDKRYLQPFVVSQANNIAFSRMLAVAKANDIEVFWMTMPVPERIKAKRTELNYESELLDYLEGFVKKGNLTILQGESVVYPDDYFRDLSHLNGFGAARFGCDMRKYRPVIYRAIEEPNPDVEPPSLWEDVCKKLAN